MNDLPLFTKAPYRFGRAITLPFRNGPRSAGFVFKSAVFYALVMSVLLALFGKMFIAPSVEYVEVMIEMENTTDEDELTKLMTKMMSALGRVMLPYMLLWMGGWITWATIEAAQHRSALRDERRGGCFRGGSVLMNCSLCCRISFCICVIWDCIWASI